MCHGYAHGSAVRVRFPLLQYFEISTMLYHILTTIFDDIYYILNKDYIYEDKMLVDSLVEILIFFKNNIRYVRPITLNRIINFIIKKYPACYCKQDYSVSCTSHNGLEL